MKNIPESHNGLMPYLILQDAGKFAHFAEIVFGAVQQYHRFREDGTTIMHAELKLKDLTIMYSDATIEFPAQPGGFFIYVPHADTTYQTALNAGAKTIMPPDDQSYGRSCGVLDPFGNTWWITSL